MDIRDELNAMLENLKSGSVPAEKEKAAENGSKVQTESLGDESEEKESSQDESAPKPDSADSLIADIRENAANAIMEISEEVSAETEVHLPPTGTDSDLKAADSEGKKAPKKSRFVSALENILRENPDSIAGERSEKTEPDEEDSNKKISRGKLRRNFFAFLGVVFTAFAVIGLAASIKFAARNIHSFTSGAEKKSDFINVVYPAVIMDISAFDSPDQLPNDQIISAALWSMIMSADDMDKYEKTFDVISVPEIDVEAYAAKLFGSSIPAITHETVGSGELKFYYNSDSKCYNVPANPLTFTYKPQIKSISKDGSEFTIVVDYIKEIPEWMENSPKYDNVVSKTVQFKLISTGDSYRIESMVILNVNPIA